MGILTRRNIRKAKGLYPRPPCDCREVFSCGEGLPRQAVTQPTDKRHSRPSGASSVVKGENEIRACSPDRVFVMKNRTFVEFISKIRAAWLFLHIANKKLVPMRIKSRTSGLMQTPREISHTGNPTGGAEAHPAVLPAAHEATDNPDNIFYRTIRTAMKKQLIYLLASACLLAAGCSTENKTDETGYGTLAINCTADTSIDTASAEASGTPEAPAAGAFSLTVTGETGTQKWDTLTEFEQSQTVFRMGAYTVAIAHGNPDAEGAGKPYYYAEQKIEVVPRRTVNADLTATVANSQVVIRATEQFLAYFHDARFTVTTASGNEFAFTLTDAMFDAEGNCIEPFAFDLSSPNGIESLQVTVGSTNSQFLASMSAIQLPQTFDLCALDASSAAGIILKGFGYPVGSELKGQTAKSFNIAGQIRALYEFDGTHTFAFTMTDAKGVSSEAVLTLVVDKSSGQTGPRITWRGYDIDQQYEVQKDMVIDIDIEADKGIKSFFVTIDSETLRPLLPVINLPEKFDICDIPDELVEVLHGEFGFPINEQVKNRTSVTFSITKFVEILLEIPGEHNFVLDVTDNDNVLTHKTVKLIVH